MRAKAPRPTIQIARCNDLYISIESRKRCLGDGLEEPFSIKCHRTNGLAHSGMKTRLCNQALLQYIDRRRDGTIDVPYGRCARTKFTSSHQANKASKEPRAKHPRAPEARMCRKCGETARMKITLATGRGGAYYSILRQARKREGGKPRGPTPQAGTLRTGYWTRDDHNSQ